MNHAKTWADYCARELMNCHRGAFDIGDAVVIFGNDGFKDDERSRLILEVVRQDLDDLGLHELDFALSDDGYTWAMVVDGKDAPTVFDAVWNAARIILGASDFINTQATIAAKVLREGREP